MNISSVAHETINVYCPEGFDPTRYVPDKLADAARYFVHLVEARRVFDHRRARDTFTPLKMQYLRNTLGANGKAEAVRDALLSAGVVECDGHYVKGSKALGYRLHPDWRTTFRKHTIEDKTLNKAIRRHAQEYQTEGMVPVHFHLRDWLHRVQIDHQGATNTLETGDDDYVPKLLSVQMIRDQAFWFRHDKYGRCHTNLTSLSRQFRPYLSVQGRALVTIDIRNSQPFFLNLVLDNYKSNNKELKSFHNQAGATPGDQPLHYDEYSLSPSQKLIRQIRKLEEKEDEKNRKHPQWNIPLHYDEFSGNDLLKYRELTCSGRFYDYLMQKMGVPPDRRSEWKRDFFGGVFFCSNRTQSPFKELFRNEFPTVSEIVCDLKRKDHAHLAHYLQRAESSVMIHRVCRRLMDEHPDTPVLTIHDSISTTPTHYLRQKLPHLPE
jgi:hypothetical protein